MSILIYCYLHIITMPSYNNNAKFSSKQQMCSKKDYDKIFLKSFQWLKDPWKLSGNHYFCTSNRSSCKKYIYNPLSIACKVDPKISLHERR